MKRTIVTVSVFLSLVVALWIGFSLGVYYHARVAAAFTANQVLLVRELSMQHEDPATSARRADEIATRWETRAENITLLDAFDPHNVFSLPSLFGEKLLLQRNHEIRERSLVMADQR